MMLKPCEYVPSKVTKSATLVIGVNSSRFATCSVFSLRPYTKVDGVTYAKHTSLESYMSCRLSQACHLAELQRS